MERIESFCVDHNKLEPGVYISRIDGDITTYDLRFIKPNTPPFLDNKSIHTIEHLFATIARNSVYKDNIIYFGPMGCRTGFYFLVRKLDEEASLKLIKSIIKDIAVYEGDIPGSTAAECGNYLDHNLPAAIDDAKKYYGIIKDKTVNDLKY